MIKPRDSYIDIIKFVFGIMIVLFHFGNGYMPGGRIAVEGFFMISGYFMMASISKEKAEGNSLGKSTICYISHKYFLLLPFLLPSVLLATIPSNIIHQRTFTAFLKVAPLLFFDIVPLQALGFNGWYTVGISWYLSAMMVSL